MENNLEYPRMYETKVIQPYELDNYIKDDWIILKIMEKVDSYIHTDTYNTTDNYGNHITSYNINRPVETRTTEILIGYTMAQKVLYDKLQKEKENAENETQ